MTGWQRKISIKALIISLVISVFPHTYANDKYPENKLTYSKPAGSWVEALPLGNGRLGAMVYGVPTIERIQLNESTIWAGGPYRNDNLKMLSSLGKIQKLIFEDKFKEAEDLAVDSMISKVAHGMPFQTAGDLFITFNGHEKYQDYQRQLSLDKAIATTQYSVGKTKYKREVFTSFPDQVLVIKLSASETKSLNFSVSLNRSERATVSVTDDFLLKMAGISSDHEGIKGQVKFEVLAKVNLEGGKLSKDGNSLKIKDADSATIYLSIGTNFKRFDNVSGDQHSVALEKIAAPGKKSYNAMQADHTAFYQQYFNRVKLNLGTANSDNLDTDQRVKSFSKTNDPQLVSLYFQFGRYLLISSSQPDSQPANLQGLWNDKLFPAWDSKYTININAEMNYWPAEITNLSELHTPLIQMVKDLAETGKETARVMYGARGWVAHHNTDIWRFTGAVDGAPGLWPTGSAWLSQHLWDKYTFSGDVNYLRSVYPILKDASLFFLDFLIPEPTNGWLVVSPSMSPENAPYSVRKDWKVITAGASLDNQLVFDLFSKTIAAAKVLNQDSELISQLQKTMKKLPPMQIGQHGQLQEWLHDWDSPTDHHRHVSHLYALYPSNQISPFRTPELFDAARVSLIHRGDPSTGWSMNWKINLWARLLDGNHALKLITDQITLVENYDENNIDYEGGGGTYANLFDAHPPFQIDGNFGFTSGVTEMLLQSHDGAVHVLPALPTAWKTGRVEGLKARGGVEIISLQWNDNAVNNFVIKSHIGGVIRIRSYWKLRVNKTFNEVKNTKNENIYFQTPEIRSPLIKSKKTTKPVAPTVYEYDVKTVAGELIEFTKI